MLSALSVPSAPASEMVPFAATTLRPTCAGPDIEGDQTVPVPGLFKMAQVSNFIAAVSLTWREFWDAPGQVLDKEPQAGAGSLRRLDGATPPAPPTGSGVRFRTPVARTGFGLPRTVDVPGRPGQRRASGLPGARCH